MKKSKKPFFRKMNRLLKRTRNFVKKKGIKRSDVEEAVEKNKRRESLF